MRNLLKGISDATLSDKLTHCADLGLVNRDCGWSNNTEVDIN